MLKCYIGDDMIIDRLKKVGIFVLLFVLFLYSDLFYIIPLYLLKVDLSKLSYTAKLLGSNISSLILIGIIVLIYHKYLKEKFKDYKKHFNEYFDFGMKWWFVGVIGMVILNLLITNFTPLKEATNEALVDDMIVRSPLLSFISAGLIAPFVEEMIFRKSFSDMFKNKWVMIIASGITFGLLHVVFSYNTLLDFLYVLPYGFLGSTFAYVLSQKDNVLIPITFHLIHNSILTLVTIISMGL